MPTYEYQCTREDCGHSFETQARMSDPDPLRGPGCNRDTCSIQKKLTRVSAFVKGAGAAREGAKAAIRDRAIIEKVGHGGPAVAKEVAESSAPHVCTLYCSHHK